MDSRVDGWVYAYGAGARELGRGRRGVLAGQRCDGADRGRPCWSSALEDLRLELHQSMGHGGQGNLSR